MVKAVAPGSIAEECGILPGDRLISLNGEPLRDLLDYRFLSSSEELELLFVRGDQEHEAAVAKDWDDDLGIEFEDVLFDRIRTCRNNCTFCFLKNLPRGLRRSLYIKDDDYRLSFLFGNFVTLSNLKDQDLDRIERQRLTPLYVSVHATERRLRNRLLGIEAPDILQQIDDLGRRRIRVHAQIVLCPGINDGEALARTIGELACRSETVLSVAAVPVGITRFCGNPELRVYTREEAKDIIHTLRPLQKRFRRELGRTLLQISDEFYTMAGVPVPPASWYDGFPQLENGVGLVRRLLLGWAGCRRRLPASLSRPRHVGWICGTSAYPTLLRLAEEMNCVDGLRVEVSPVENLFFGTTVTVSGLLTGVDVLRRMHNRRADLWVLPRAMLDSTGEMTLDGMTLDQLRRDSPDSVATAANPLELMKLTLSGGAPCAE